LPDDWAGPELARWRIVTETLKPPPKRLGVTHWSTRLPGARLKVANSTIARAWRAYGIQPGRTGSFRFSTDPMLEAKVVDVIALYLDPPENAVVLGADEKSQIQALERAVGPEYCAILSLAFGVTRRDSSGCCAAPPV
jgi:hypothetical protein